MTMVAGIATTELSVQRKSMSPHKKKKTPTWRSTGRVATSGPTHQRVMPSNRAWRRLTASRSRASLYHWTYSRMHCFIRIPKRAVTYSSHKTGHTRRIHEKYVLTKLNIKLKNQSTLILTDEAVAVNSGGRVESVVVFTDVGEIETLLSWLDICASKITVWSPESARRNL